MEKVAKEQDALLAQRQSDIKAKLDAELALRADL